MLTISKPLSSAQAQSYHKLEFTSETQNYYKHGDAVRGEWQGQLAARLGLSGEVSPLEFSRLAEGRNPSTDEQMVKHRTAFEYKNADGTTTKAVEHRAGWDATFSAPKSVSLTALVGGDDRVREAHRAAVIIALDELERYTQARIGGNNPAENGGKFIAAKFEHDTARPVDGYAAPQLHTHAVIFNVTERADGTTRAIQPQGLFDSQNFATAVYQAELTHRLTMLGYEIETGRSGAPEIKGYTQEYLDASSPRSRQIREQLEKAGYSGPEAAQIAAHSTRDRKQTLTADEVLSAHKQMASAFGDQPQQVVSAARARAEQQERQPEHKCPAKEAVTFSRDNIFKREAVADERAILRDALRRAMGEATYRDVRAEFDKRQEAGDFRIVQGTKHRSGRTFTTPETIAAERANIRQVLEGRNAIEPIMSAERAREHGGTRSFLNDSQRRVVEEFLNSSDRVHGLQGLAGTGKTIVALHRAAHLARRNRNARVLLATFSEPLANALRAKLRLLLANEPRLGERIEVHSMNAIGRRLYELNIGKLNIATDAQIADFLRQASKDAGEHKFSLRFLTTEWEQVVDSWQLDKWEEYRDVNRLGRKTRLREEQRKLLWAIFEAVRAGLREQRLITTAGIFNILSRNYANGASSPFDFVVVDEAQDTGIAQVRFLASISGGRANGLFFAGDLGQRIFQQPFSLKAAGADVRGRSTTLRINYRTSHQIRSQADRLLDPQIVDVDGNVESRKGAVSLFNGPRPDIKTYSTSEEESKAVAYWLRKLAAEGVQPHEIALFVRSARQLDRAKAAADLAAFKYRVLDEHVDIAPGSLSISTMHLAKGLEFRAVSVMACDDEVIPLQERIEAVADESDLQDVYTTERHLLYVACTRARDQLLVTSAKPASEFLGDMSVEL